MNGRRAFLRDTLAVLAVALVPACRRPSGGLPAPWRAAVRVGRYPGPLRPLDPARVARPGPWAG